MSTDTPKCFHCGLPFKGMPTVVAFEGMPAGVSQVYMHAACLDPAQAASEKARYAETVGFYRSVFGPALPEVTPNPPIPPSEAQGGAEAGSGQSGVLDRRPTDAIEIPTDHLGSVTCGYDMSCGWSSSGRCTRPIACPEHSGLTCGHWGCDKPARMGCGHAGTFVCGRPVCGEADDEGWSGHLNCGRHG